MIRTSRGHTFTIVGNIHKSPSDLGVKEKLSSSGKRKIRTGGGTRKEKVRFDTEKRSSAKNVGERKGGTEKEGKVGAAEVKEHRKGRSSQNTGEKFVKGKKGDKKSGLSGGGDKCQRVDESSSRELEQDREEEESSGAFMTQIEGKRSHCFFTNDGGG